MFDIIKHILYFIFFILLFHFFFQSFKETFVKKNNHLDNYRIAKYKNILNQHCIYDYIAIPVILLEGLECEAWVNSLGSGGS